MKTKELVHAAILLAVGTVLHLIPGIVNGVKPDFLLACMFVIIMLTPNFKMALTVGVVAGVLAAITTSFPGGQIPNILDKVISGMFVLALAKTLPISGRNRSLSIATKALIFFLGTLCSGAIFLGSALFLVGLPGGAGFGAMFVAIVLPTSIANIIFGTIVDRIVATYKSKVFA